MLLFFTLIFLVPVLYILSSGFQQWLKHKERTGQLIADETAERAAQYAAQVERIEARVRVLEQIATDQGIQTAAQIEALRASPSHSLHPSKDRGFESN